MLMVKLFCVYVGGFLLLYNMTCFSFKKRRLLAYVDFRQTIVQNLKSTLYPV